MCEMKNTLHQLLMDLHHMVDAEISAGRNSSALKLIDEAESIIAANIEVQIKRATILRSLGKVDESVETLLDINHNNPNNIWILHQLAISQHIAGDISASDLSLCAALAIHPGHPDILLGKIQNSEKIGAYQQALERTKIALDIHPKNITFSIKYGIFLRNTGRSIDSTRHFESLFSKHHNNIDTCLELARIRIAQHRYPAAKNLIDKVLRAAPHNNIAIMLGIECAMLSGCLMHAIQLAQDAGPLADKDFSIALTLARLYRTAGWPKLAIEQLHSLPEPIIDSTPALLIKADSYADIGLFEHASSLYEEILSKHHQEPSAILKSIDLALCGHGNKSTGSILDGIQRRLSTAKKAAPEQTLMFEATARAGDWKRLLEHYQELTNPSESQSNFMFFSALALYGLGNLKSAQNSIIYFLRKYPNDFRGKMLLADIELSLGNRETSFTIRKSLASTKGLPRQEVIREHAIDLFRNGEFSEAHKCFAPLKVLDGHFPTPTYIDELLMHGDEAEAAICSEKINAFSERAKLSSTPHSRIAAGNLIQPQKYIDQSHLEKLFDFDSGDSFFGYRVNPAAFLAWRLSKGRFGNYQEWSRRASQATQASKTLQHTPARHDDLEKFIAPLALTPIETLLQNGQSFILASTHMGPAAGTYLTHRIPNIMYFQNMTTVKSAETVGASGISITGKPHEAAIMAVTALRRRKVLSTTPDVDILALTRKKTSPMAKATARLFGVDIDISNMAPKLSRELNVPSYWFQPQWKNGKIHFIIEQLPLPHTDEEPATWYNRWAQTYLTKLEHHMMSEPENQNLDAPLWRYLLYHAQKSTILSPLLK